MPEKRLIAVLREKDGTIHPISIYFSQFYTGVDKVAVFTSDAQIKRAIKSIKQSSPCWIGQIQGKFVIVNLEKKHSLPINIAMIRGTVAHDGEGKIYRPDVIEINGMPAKEWVDFLRKKKQLKIV